jgi:hypothetical protein
MERGIPVQRLMDPHVIIVGCKLAKGPAQVGVPEYDHVVNAFSSDRADQSFRESISATVSLPQMGFSTSLSASAPSAFINCSRSLFEPLTLFFERRL